LIIPAGEVGVRRIPGLSPTEIHCSVEPHMVVVTNTERHAWFSKVGVLCRVGVVVEIETPMSPVPSKVTTIDNVDRVSWEVP
jgi:hypothetical protein